MNKRIFSLTSILLGVSLSFSSIAKYEISKTADSDIKYVSMNVLTDNLSTYSIQADTIENSSEQQILSEVPNQAVQIPNNKDKSTSISKNSTSAPLSRGGSPSQEQLKEAKEKAKASAKTINKNKTELLDWWKSARYVFSNDSIAKVTDIGTGKSFMVKRTGGTNHADSEALTKEDTAIIKSIWGGFSWDRHPVIVEIDGRRLAASMAAMPHAGLDSAPAKAYVKNRSGDFGSGTNLDSVKNNNMDGHFDIHFLNSTRHMDGKEDPEHQAAIMKIVNR